MRWCRNRHDVCFLMNLLFGVGLEEKFNLREKKSVLSVSMLKMLNPFDYLLCQVDIPQSSMSHSWSQIFSLHIYSSCPEMQTRSRQALVPESSQPCASKNQRPRVAAEDEEDNNARELLTKLGFDTDNLNKKHDGDGCHLDIMTVLRT